MVRIYTLTLTPSLGNAAITPQIYPESKFRYTSPVFGPDGGGISIVRVVVHLGGTAATVFPTGDVTGEHPIALLADENVPISTVEARDWTRQNFHAHVESSGEQYRFVMPGAALTGGEFYQLRGQVPEIGSGVLLVISGSLSPDIQPEKLTRLITTARKQRTRYIVGSSGEALTVVLAISNIGLTKSNPKELSALISRELTQPGNAQKAAQEVVQSGRAHRAIVSLGPQGALGADHDTCVQMVPPPMKSQSTVGAGGSMVGAVTLKLAENAPFEGITRYGAAAGNAATLNQGTHLCSLDDTQKIYLYFAR